MLSELHLREVGPAPSLDVEFAERLNIFTGDNGLGKTFLLDCAWWSLTGSWPGLPALPRAYSTEAWIAPKAAFDDEDSIGLNTPMKFRFNYRNQSWFNRLLLLRHRDRLQPAIYARADGGVSIFEPLLAPIGSSGRAIWPLREKSYCLNFGVDQIWEEYKEGVGLVCNGLIRDLVHWQYSPDQDDRSAFASFNRVLQKLTHPDEAVEIGKSSRIYLHDPRHYPSIKTAHGEYPIHLAPAGLKRTLGLAYLIVWAWKEHQELARLSHVQPASHLDILVDEIELHLHPKWQRSILPALMDVGESLPIGMTTQLLITTHSPLVLASIEPLFDKDQDRLFLFDIEAGRVSLNELPWAKHGDATNWLTSPIFGLAQARSLEAEAVIEAAEAFMRGDFAALPEGLKTKEEIHAELCRVVAGHDEFWPRWIVQECEVAR